MPAPPGASPSAVDPTTGEEHLRLADRPPKRYTFTRRPGQRKDSRGRSGRSRAAADRRPNPSVSARLLRPPEWPTTSQSSGADLVRFFCGVDRSLHTSPESKTKGSRPTSLRTIDRVRSWPTSGVPRRSVVGWAPPVAVPIGRSAHEAAIWSDPLEHAHPSPAERVTALLHLAFGPVLRLAET